jgi:hypothetical protein
MLRYVTKHDDSEVEKITEEYLSDSSLYSVSVYIWYFSSNYFLD